MARKKGYANINRLRSRVEQGKSQGGVKKVRENLPVTGFYSTLSKYLLWLEGRRLAEQTIYHRRADLEQFLTWACERSLHEPSAITLQVLESFQRWLIRYRKRDGRLLSSRTVRSRLSTLQDYFRWLVRQNYIGANPASELILPKKEMRLPE